MKKIFIIPLILMFGCEYKQPKQIIKKCIIDSLEIKQSISTIEPEPIYLYYTNCGNTITTKSKYNIGDTITYYIESKK